MLARQRDHRRHNATCLSPALTGKESLRRRAGGGKDVGGHETLSPRAMARQEKQQAGDRLRASGMAGKGREARRLIPVQDQRGKLEPPEFFHEVLVHRWYLSERAGHEVDIFDAAADYIARVLPQRPDELVAAD